MLSQSLTHMDPSAMTSACDFQQHSVLIDREGRGRGLRGLLALKQEALEEESA